MDKINDPDGAKACENLIFITFFSGVNYNEQPNGNTYLYEIYGFLIILFFCVLERKAQIWLSNKFGFEGSQYNTYKGRIKLETYASELTLFQEASPS